VNQNLSAAQRNLAIPAPHSGGRSPFTTEPYEDDVPDVAPFSGVKRSKTVQSLSAANRTSATRETAWATTSLKQEAPVSFSKQTKGTLFQWDDSDSKPSVIQPQSN